MMSPLKRTQKQRQINDSTWDTRFYWQKLFLDALVMGYNMLIYSGYIYTEECF